MLIDMHCHTKEGSIDARISVREYLNLLPRMGYDGVLVTDHNSYGGYHEFKSIEDSSLRVFKGIEYDTCDAGHIIVIMPTGVDTRFLTVQGMPIRQLIKIVHLYGGILGAAHPFDYKLLGMANIKRWSLMENLDIWSQLDFIEGFNSCGSPTTNALANKLANYLGKVQTSGSDTHRIQSAGLAGTVIADDPKNESDLIEIIKSSKGVYQYEHNRYFEDAMSKKHRLMFNIGLLCCYTNNKIKHSMHQVLN